MKLLTSLQVKLQLLNQPFRVFLLFKGARSTSISTPSHLGGYDALNSVLTRYWAPIRKSQPTEVNNLLDIP